MSDGIIYFLLSIIIVILATCVAFLALLTYKLSSNLSNRARSLYQEWRANDYENLLQEQKAIALREAEVSLQEWKSKKEKTIRNDAISRSKSAIAARVREQFSPYFPNMSFNPKDARFIGSPIDLVIFDGLDNGKVENIIFVEVKTGSSSLSERQKLIREAIQLKKVIWSELRISN
ncbi:Holliday junction resolvase-like protein [Thalassoporum mexicanum PCC 7367]|uniref:Holliday junction resolvase-like protein n=1 Tax=Thalassoporum mexicanum TaxID=3457544 RepID=UPI00029FEEFC|nr:Holliday junction resolvase-like protein [Pseudanabaena sp. PCC 7367]AFY68581.1 Holliday junction resolvase-like protein [Pseudanabaena sp. PCC 7367]